jgi:hypothetical protein
MPVLGAPQDSLGVSIRFGAKGAAGAAGEHRSAALLNWRYADDSSTWVLHHCRAPGFSHADVDHVVVRGSTVVVIDTKCWKPGRYRRLGDTVFYGATPFGAVDHVLLGQVVIRVSADLPGISVHGLGAVWASKPTRLGLGFGPWRVRFPGGVPVCHGKDLLATVEKLLGPHSGDPAATALSYWKVRQL